MVEVGNPIHAATHILRRGQWLMPNVSHADLRAVEAEMPGDVKYLGDIREIKHPAVPETLMRWQCLVWELTDAAYAECVKKSEERYATQKAQT